MTVELQTQKRTATGSAASARLRAEGRVPAVVYGPKHAALSISIHAKEFEKVYAEAGESTVLTLTGDEGKTEVLVSDLSRDPVRGQITHVDFYAVEKDKVVEVEVPLAFTGVAPAEKELGGTLIKVLYEIAIEAKPKDLPHEIAVDISTLRTFDDQIHVRDLTMPQGVVAVTDADEVVALVQAAREEEESSAPVDLSAIEVEKKGKEEPDA